MSLPHIFGPVANIPNSWLDDNFNAVSGTAQTSLKTFGAVGNGVADDTAAVTAALSTVPIYAPTGTYLTTIATGAAIGPCRLFGSGQIKTADGDKRAPYFSQVTTAPTAFAPPGAAVDQAFNGDLSHVQFAVEQRIMGADTATKPTTGYTYIPELSPYMTYLYNESGWNNALDGSYPGRTGISAHDISIYQAGQGDLVGVSVHAFITSTKAGSTSYLANPALSCVSGGMASGVDGANLTPMEWEINDNGYDCGSIGLIIRPSRTNNTGAKYAFWQTFRSDSRGTKGIDSAFLATGPHNQGLDLTFCTLPTSGTYNQAAIVLKANQRIYFNGNGIDASGLSRYSSAIGQDYWEYFSSLPGLVAVVNNTAVLQLSSTQVTVPVTFSHFGSYAGFFGTTPITKPTVTGSKGGNAAITSLLTQLANLGLITDSST